jgi:uncharacterized alpha-E superfamily protein
MLLSRVAANLYWAARYLERAEGTARIVREQTSLFVDAPYSLELSWDPLLAVTGSAEPFAARYEQADEDAIVAFLVADVQNPGSIHASITQARENLRSAREVFPAQAWVVVNDLHLYVDRRVSEGLHRRSRARFLGHVITEHQRLIGVLASTMTRDDAYTMLRLGRHLERADMATRVLDVRAGQLLATRSAQAEAYDDLQWLSMLRSLSAAQMYQRDSLLHGIGNGPIGFVLHEQNFPRSVRYCLRSAQKSAARLPNPAEVLEAIDQALTVLDAIEPATLDAARLHETADRLEVAIGEVHQAIYRRYFRPLVV